MPDPTASGSKCSMMPASRSSRKRCRKVSQRSCLWSRRKPGDLICKVTLTACRWALR